MPRKIDDLSENFESYKNKKSRLKKLDMEKIIKIG